MVEKTDISNERKLIERIDIFMDKADKLNIKAIYMYGNSLIRFKVCHKEFATLSQIYDMLYSRIDPKDRKRIDSIKKKIRLCEVEGKKLKKGRVYVEEEFYNLIKTLYSKINRIYEEITTTRKVKKDAGNVSW